MRGVVTTQLQPKEATTPVGALSDESALNEPVCAMLVFDAESEVEAVLLWWKYQCW